MKKRGLRLLGLMLLVAAMLSGCIVWPYYYDDGYWGGYGHRHGHHRHHGY